MTVKILSGLIAVLIVCMLVAGCLNNSSSANTTTKSAQTTTSQTVPTSIARYTAGDIVKSPTGESGNGWLVISYDPASDSYERAIIYRNTDGSWGYRVDTRTVTSKRTSMENAFPDKVTHVTVSSVGVRKPTVAPTPVITYRPVGTTTTTASVTATTTTTVSSTAKPSIKNVVPDFGNTGTQVLITGLSGSNFLNGATVKLARSGNPNISATNVVVVSPTQITCTFALPSNATAGTWDVVVSNPNGLVGTYTNYFSIHTSTIPVTTTGPVGGGVGVTSIEPSSKVTGGGQDYVITTITGTGFQSIPTIKLTKGDQVIIGTFLQTIIDTSQIKASFAIPAGYVGSWNVVVTNPDGSTGSLANGFTIQ